MRRRYRALTQVQLISDQSDRVSPFPSLEALIKEVEALEFALLPFDCNVRKVWLLLDRRRFRLWLELYLVEMGQEVTELC